MDTELNRSNEFKFIFASVSLLLMIPPLINGGEVEYFRTLFIFLINRIIDLIFLDKNSTSSILSTWNFFNKLTGLWACAFSFCLMTSTFEAIIPQNLKPWINCILFVISLSYVLKEFFELFYKSKRDAKLIDDLEVAYYNSEPSVTKKP